jgi:hypothetical protein
MTFDLEILRDLENMLIDEAKSKSIEIIKSSKTKQAVMNRLVFDINKAHTSREVMRIMWATYMSGTGFGTLSSAWKKHYNGI